MSDQDQNGAAFFQAIQEGEGEALVAQLKAMLEKAPDLANARDAQGTSALRFSLYHRKSEATELLLAAGITLDAYDAASVGDVTRLAECLEADADLHAQAAGDAFTLLHLASFFNQLEAVKALLAAGADVNAETTADAGLRPLHSAVASKAAAVARKLLAAGAEVDAKQAGGWTALHAAAKHGDMEMVLLLLEHQADMELKADDGRTASDLAEDESQDDVKLLLFRYS